MTSVVPAQRDDRQVMRDRQVREAKAALKIVHQVGNLRLYGHCVLETWCRTALPPCAARGDPASLLASHPQPAGAVGSLKIRRAHKPYLPIPGTVTQGAA
jgi:hypothetical protein